MTSLGGKKAWKSKGLQGSVLAIVAILAPVILKRTGLADDLGGQDVVDLVGHTLALVGAGLAGVGRLTARERIR